MAKLAGCCPVCGSTDVRRILDLERVPVFCNVQLDSREEARSQPTGQMRLEYCGDCTHIFNSAFDEALLAYDQSYENSLHFSGTFNSFARELARRLVDAHGLRGKKVVDIGCGKGDFLALICELGANHGYGFDKSYEEGRAKQPSAGSVRYYREFFSDAYADIAPDLVTCRHVLEHIPAPGNFLADIAGTVATNRECAFYFEVPNALYNIRDLGIWDLIYEHCQYFTPQSLRTVFAGAGMDVSSVSETFGGQFLSVDAALSDERPATSGSMAGAGDSELEALASGFRGRATGLIAEWSERLRAVEGDVVVWGAGSKGVTFLNLVEGADRVSGIVDINPHKHGKFIAGSGHEVLAPEQLHDIRPDAVLVMNPLYTDEIANQLESLGLAADVVAVR